MLAERLRRLRVEQGLTQGELGELTGLSASAIGMYEQGRREPGHDIMARLCHALGATIGQLLGEGEESVSLASRDLEEILSAFSTRLAELEGLSLEGRSLTREERRRVADAVQLGARLALARRIER